MFGHLKKKLQQGVAQSKAVVAGLTRGDDSSEDNTSSDSLGTPVAESTPQKDVGHGGSTVEDFNTPVFSVAQKRRPDLSVSSGPILNNSLSEGSGNIQYESASDVSSLPGDVTPKDNRSRTSSVSSMTSDSTFFPSINLSSNSLQSDNESEVENTSLNLSSVSREDLYAFIKRFEQRAFKYKSKFMEVAAAYKETLEERDKLKSLLAHVQDGSLHHASELDLSSRINLDERYKHLLEEKDEYTKVLQMQVQLLKEGKDVPEELEANLLSKQAKAESALPTTGGADKGSSSPNEEIELLISRIKRQDGLLQKCKNTISSYKEKIVQLSQDKQDLHGKLELLSKASDRTNSNTPDQVSRLQTQMHEARKVIEQLESDREVAIAEFKQQIHEEMEKKDAELEHVKGQHQKFIGENHSLKLEIDRLTNETEDLRRINLEQLEKARNIMRKLKDDKKLALEQAETRIRQAEQSMEEEKEKMLIDLKRGKAEAFSVMQQESEKNLAEKVEAAVEERDQFWNKKMAAQEGAHLEMLQAKDREKEMVVATMQEEVRHRLKEKEEEVKLALEERELQKMAALTGLDEQKDKLLLQIEELSSEKIKLCNRFSKFQEDTGHQISKLKDRLNKKVTEHNRQIYEMQLSQEEALKREKSTFLHKATEEMELLKQRHAEEIHNLTDKHEQEMQESNSEMESYYKNQFESEKVKLENLLAVTKDQLGEMRNAYSLNQTKLMETEQPLNTAGDELTNITRKQGLHVGADTTDQGKQPFSESVDPVQKITNQTDQENRTVIQLQALEELNSELRLMCQVLTEKLKTVKEELATAENELVSLKTENGENGTQQMMAQSGHERERSNDHVQELKEKIIELDEENECLKRNVENSRIKVEELEKCLEETLTEKKASESKSRECEIQVGQLQEVIRALESCQNTVEREKESLEQKLTFLENIVEDLKASKEEMNEKLHDRHEALIQQFTEKKQTLEFKVSELSSQIDILKEDVDALNKALLSKNDENIALRSVVDDNVSFVKSLEDKIDKLTVDLQMKSQTSSQNEAALAKSLEKFEKLKNEANAKVKGLKEIKDSLTEQLNKQQKECEDIKSALLEKDSLIKAYEEKLIKQQEEMRTLEQTFKEQFDKKQAKFKELVNKLKEQHENKLKEKEKQFDDCIKELTSQKDLGNEDLTKGLENQKNENLKHEQKPQEAVDKMAAKLETTFQTSSNSHSQELEDISSYFQQITDLQQKLSDKDSLIQELTSTTAQNVQKELDNIILQMKEMSDKHKMETDTLNLQLTEKNVQIQHLTVKLESLHEQSLPGQQENLASEIKSLTELLHEKDIKLESMAGTISAEQESLYKQLAWQTARAEEFNAQKTALLTQLKEALEKLDAELQDKDALLSEINQKNAEHALLKEMLKTDNNTSLENDNDTSPENDNAARSLQEHFEQFKAENDSKLHDLESQLETKNNSITALEEELKHLTDLHEQALAESELNHAKEIGILKSDWDSQITELQTATQALKSQLKEANEKLQECIQSYEDKLIEEKLKLEREDDSLKEQINIMKQKLHETQSQVDVSSSLLQNVKEGEEKLASQLQNEVKAVKQDAEQKMSNLKQKYIGKLKEMRTHAKKTIEELENTLQVEKLAKNEMYSELTRTNTRLLQLEENTGTSKDTIVDLERKVVEMTALIKSKDNELTKLKTDMEESDKNMQEILEETQVNCEQINNKLTEAETKLKDEESNLQIMNDKLQTKLALLTEKDTIVKHLENRCSELENMCIQEKEKLEHHRNDSNKRCLELEYLLEKTRNKFDENQNKFAELECKFQSASSSATELENVQAEKSCLQTELSQLTAENEELKSKLLVTEAAFEKSLREHTSFVTEMEMKLSENESHQEQIKQHYETKLSQLQQEQAAELLELGTQSSFKIAECKKMAEQDYETKLNQLQQAQAAQLSELDAQSNTKIAEYKKKAEAYITQMKKQFEDEHTVIVDQKQEHITKLEETIAILTKEISELKQSKEILATELESIMQDLKSQVDDGMRIKQSDTEQYCQKEKEFEQAEQTLRKVVAKLEEENRLLLGKLGNSCEGNDDRKMQCAIEIENLKSVNNEFHKSLEFSKSDKDEELTAQKTDYAVQKSHQTVLEKQTNEQTPEMELDKETKHPKAKKEKEFTRSKAVDKSEQHGQDLKDQQVLNELRKQVSEKDKHTKKLHAEYQAKMQALQVEQARKVTELQSVLESTKLDCKQKIDVLETKLKFGYQKDSQARDGSHHQNFIALTQELNSGNKETFEQNPTALSAPQSDTSDYVLLQEQVTLLTRHIEQMKEQHKLELAEIHSRLEVRHNSLPQPMAAGRLNMDVLDPNFSVEMQNLELQNMNLQAQVSQLYGALSMYKIKERDQLRKKEKLEHAGMSISDDDDPPLSLDMNHTDSPIFREPTEFEYLRNILYEYMMGRETKTLAKVISTVVKFSDEQMKNVMAKADTKVIRKS